MLWFEYHDERAMQRVTFGMKSRAGQPRSVCGRVFQTLFFLVFLGMGLLFVVFIGRETWVAMRTRFWQATPCLILSSTVATHPESQHDSEPYRFVVSYRYSVGDREHNGSVYRHKYDGDGSYEDARARAARFPAGATVTGYVDPNNPSESVLEHTSPWIGLFVLLPLVFVLVGLGGIWSAWTTAGPVSGASQSAGPISSSAKGVAGHLIGMLMCGGFAVMGALMTWFLFVQPMINVADARSWAETPCQIVSSRVQTHDNDDGNTYSVDILYAYEFAGNEHLSSRYNFSLGSSGGYDGKAAVVRRHPPGSETVCYVNTRDPSQAVLNREFSGDLWFGLIPAVFMLAGVGGLVHFMRVVINPRPVVPVTPTNVDPGGWSPSSMGPVVLKPKHTPFLRLVGAVFICLFWNGIVSVFVWQIIKGFQRSRPEWFLTIFMIPFVLIGILFVGMVIHQFLALFNPRVTLTVHNAAVRLGDILQLDWETSGRVTALALFAIKLEGREEATFQQGTSTRTDKHIFTSIVVHETDQPVDIMTGHAQVMIPSHLVASFNAPCNKIIWTLNVTGQIRFWPDLKEEYEIVVLPSRTRS